MAKSKVPLMLRASFTSTTGEQPGPETVNIDLSAYVDALSGKVLKINDVQLVIDSGAGLPFSDADIDTSSGGELMAQLVTGTQTAAKGCNDDRMIAMKVWYLSRLTAAGPDYTAASNPSTNEGVIYNYEEFHPPQKGFYVAADNLTFLAQSVHDIDSSIRYICVIEAERVKLSAADVNFLLVNQTITG